MRGSLPLDPLGFGGDFVKVENPDLDFPAGNEVDPRAGRRITRSDARMLERDGGPGRSGFAACAEFVEEMDRVNEEYFSGLNRLVKDLDRDQWVAEWRAGALPKTSDRDNQDYGRCTHCDAEKGEEHRPDCEYWARRRIREEQISQARAKALKEMQEQARPRQFYDAADGMVYALTGATGRRVVIERKS